MTQQYGLFLDLVRSFTVIPSRRHREKIASLARALAEPDA
jgi:hypothetical protein